MATVVIDTNVILVANEQHEDVTGACVAACASTLNRVMKHERVAIDNGNRILDEYLVMSRPYKDKRAGDIFVKWLLRNSYNLARCDRVQIDEDPVRGFVSFPEDNRLANFDIEDRKFVAVSCAHEERPVICQATDSKWLSWAPALHDHGVAVEFLCPSEIRRFDAAKKLRKEHEN